MPPLVTRTERIAVFCGARTGHREDHADFAYDFGRALARRNRDLVYGAGGAGVTAALADGVLAGGGAVTGILPRTLYDRDRADRARGEVFVVRSMHERKALMYRLSRGFAVLPGGIGTLDELMEVTTWNQLSLMQKPIVVVNHRGFYDPMLAMLDHLVTEGFLSPQERLLVRTAPTADEALDLLGAPRTTALAPA
ncbi:TIGR00730 family Rossman fold protein [Streptomyces subrutilus]|uniref:LOG family protein n=1 Tax=Streptomyces subrutilus TaxID=36818 RepID=UPI0033C65A4C